MAEQLRAIPDELIRVGTALADHGQVLWNLQQVCHRDADGAQSGWVGSSATALSALLDHWAAASDVHIGRLGEHSVGLHVTAAGFAESEQHSAARLAGPSAS